MFVVVIIVLAIFVVPFLLDTFRESERVAKEGGIYNKYKVLISHFVAPSEGLKVLKKENRYMCVGGQTDLGLMAFHFHHTFNKIRVILEIKSIIIGNYELEWCFPENMSQYEMISQIQEETRRLGETITGRFE